MTQPVMVSVIVLNWNGWQDTAACVHSLLAHGDPALQVVVCDNDSQDGSFQKLTQILGQGRQAVPGGFLALTRAEAEASIKRDARLVLIQNGGNLGFAGGCNVGLRYAMNQHASHFWLLNNDTEIAPGADVALIRRMQADPAVGLCGSRLIYHADRQMVQARGGATYDPRSGVGIHIGVHESVNAPEDLGGIEAAIDYVVGASMMVTRRFLDTVGLMTEDYFLYFEELDWATRGKRLGFKLAYAPQSVVFHKEGATIGSSHSGGASALSMKFLLRNRLLFTRRYFPQFLGSVRRRLLFESLVYAKRRQYRNVLLVIEALMGRRIAMPPRSAHQ